MPEYKKAGWRVRTAKAFKNTDPSIIMQMDPIPKLDRQDVRIYIEKQFALFEEAIEDQDVTIEEAMREAEKKG